MTFEEIRKALSSLSKEELKKLVGHATFLSSGTRTTKEEPNQYFIQMILLLADRNKIFVPANIINGVKSNLETAARQFKELADELHLSKSETLKLCNDLIDAAKSELTDAGIEATLATLINLKLLNPKVLLDSTYPGYSSDNLKRFILNAKTNKIHSRERSESTSTE